ncbi:putative adenine-specific DNA methyltransferase [Fimicolochytrium jonesii]|uniref:putative adenine-specific DNA methyltransferase n=1 Tax=Fimicolochytrium jonesii TaxID=1396493 RepID=UPI0022FEB4EF|nr:putative adenine-specific DNA methyltransferase [Fimicolochytrium jonesii]KAI8815644.1 putative adenine-specific DNA methyltransferase [Fimicolochytrium jonesii]
MKAQRIRTQLYQPVVKWVGGKRNLCKELHRKAPPKFGNYYEPFFGGGAFALHLHGDGSLSTSNVFLGDMSKPLMTMYYIIRDNPQEFIAKLDSEEYSWKMDISEREVAFIRCRIRFNELNNKPSLENSEEIEMSCLFLYLNKTGFNGLYRVNKQGHYNVSVDKLTKGARTICDANAVENLSAFLNREGVSLGNCSYETLLQTAKAGDFVYLDPPYDDTFVAYQKTGFSWDDQVRLKTVVDELHDRGCYIMVSNSATAAIKELYKEYSQDFTSVTSSVNSKASDRKNKRQEIIIRNYLY